MGGLGAALIALSLSGPRLAAERAPHGAGGIAFAVGASGDDRPSQLAVVDGDGKNERLLPQWPVGELSWSPDGRSIAFDDPNGSGGIWTTNVDGRLRSQLVVRDGFKPDWSPNGRSIAFERRGDVWLVERNDRRQRRLVRHGGSPSWSADGSKLAFERGGDIWVLDLAVNKQRRLVRDGEKKPIKDAHLFELKLEHDRTIKSSSPPRHQLDGPFARYSGPSLPRRSICGR